ncbi:MAG TPA: hypothetical protein VK760_05650 [Candidatus Acidoferrales bacterium]|jgi:hypothetical protein|nr:hypothetical protein [Candidatus Acidoferrales bacterium]
MSPVSRTAAMAALFFIFAGCASSTSPVSGPQAAPPAALRAPRFFVQDLGLINKTGGKLDAQFSSPNCVSGFPGSVSIDPDRRWDGQLKTVTGQQCRTGGGYAKVRLELVPPGDGEKINLELLMAVNRRGNWDVDFTQESHRSPICITGRFENLEIHERKTAPADCVS